MKIKFVLLLLSGIAPFLMGASNRVKASAQPSAVTSQTMLSIDQDFFINNTEGGEWVHFTGQLHLVTIFFTNDPIFPNDPVRIQTNVVSLKGVGETSGLTYQATGATAFSSNYQPGTTNSFITSYRLLPPNPIQPLSSSLNFSYSVSFDSFGGLTDASAVIVPVEGF